MAGRAESEAGGGRVVIVEGDYFGDWSLHDRLVADARAAGNAPLDLLVRVPPSLVARGGDADPSIAAIAFRDHDLEVWDGAIQRVRQDFARSPEQFRIVQYDSCRGLEGWTVFALRFDDFWGYKVAEGLQKHEASDDLFAGPQEAAERHAGYWSMIPMTRAMDTLVLHISPAHTPIHGVLRQLAERQADFVDWVTL